MTSPSKYRTSSKFSTSTLANNLEDLFSKLNDTLPLFGRRKYPNERTWEYYTLLGNYGSKVPVVTKNKHDELGTNDIVFIKGRKDAYRATIYESDFPQYIPYL